MAHKIELFDLLDPDDPNFERYTNKNPMVIKYGFGPEGCKCKECGFFYRKQYAKTYFKCQKRGNTNGEKTDHRANWKACKFYKPVVSSQD